MFKTRDIQPGSWKYPRGGRTLGDLMRGRIILLAVCHRCKHEGRLYPADYIERFGEDCPAVHLRRYVRCSACRNPSANLHEATR